MVYIFTDEDNPNAEPVRYPIDDLLVCPAPDDPIFTERPPLSLEFNVPMNCVGDLLMVWDFCCTFGKLLHLWPFSLDDLENAICHKDSNLTLIENCTHRYCNCSSRMRVTISWSLGTKKGNQR